MSSNQIQPPILLVDDCDLNLRLLEKILQCKGYNSVLTNSGFDALKLIEKQPFYALFLDIRMPGMDGFEVVRQIRKNFPQRITKLVAITASTLSFHDPQFKEVILWCKDWL